MIRPACTAPRAAPPAVALLAALLAVALPGCARTDADQAARGPRPVKVRTAQVALKTAPVEVQAVGRIASARSVAIRARVAGQLVAAHFTEGQAVRQGDLLLELDRRPFEAALAEARANLARDEARAENARAEAARAAELAGKEFVTRQQADAARATAAAADATSAASRAAVQRAELDLAYATLRAPSAGRTGRLLLHPGNLVGAGTQDLVTIEQVKPVLATFALPERHLAALRAAGASAIATVRPASGGPSASGPVVFIDNAVDAATGTILVRARLENADEALWPGQVVEVRLRLGERKDALVVPASAVAQGQAGDYAWVIKDGAAELRPLTVLEAGEREVVVGQGLAAGEVVVTEGQLRLTPGAKVERLEGAASP
jgi:membrane fusion protein, multidrug efflux system